MSTTKPRLTRHKFWEAHKPQLPRHIAVWAKRRRKPPTERDLAVREQRAQQAARSNEILREVEALKSQFTPIPPAAMGPLRGEPRPERYGERLRLAKLAATGRREYREKRAQLWQ